ncbi:hypothetical protein MYCTH_89976 [Thermothelomyces thermophilus ATCC 42464]|uniref:Uncharacterized protein n=1 Tax=Thermothelomyces thermophilus (strain ATCC 42464 / BCRC 31852 / DSM 1799) TaxID=573729 RepID=G2QM24_THET4|nr:uncharacterized protein MYCTH_89976 [Thermothelomyces thermophilus ATCC 42464]AEO61004.1 hypothetical protein MYCTH_89976 [Thermothelomyces thermophilus ATCC 42464]
MYDNNMSFLEHQGCFPKGSDCYDLESASESENKSGIRRVPRQLCTLRFYESDDDRPGPHSGADSACSSPPEAPDDRDQTKLGPLDGGENRFSKAHGINPALFDVYISAQKGASSPPPGITLPALLKLVDADRIGHATARRQYQGSDATADVEAATADVETATADVETATADVEAATADVEAATADVEAATADVEPATADIAAALLRITKAHTLFETRLEILGTKIVLLEERIPGSYQVAPNLADENRTLASLLTSDPNEFDASRDMASSDLSTPPLLVDCDIADVEAQTASSRMEEPETASAADADQGTTPIDLPSRRPPSPGPRTPLLSVPMPSQERAPQAPQTQDEPDQSATTQDQDETPPVQDEPFPTPGQTAVHAQDEHIETPTAQEFRSFASLYTRLSREHEPRGFVLIKVPSDVLGSCSRPTEPRITTSWRQALRWRSGLVASVEYEEVRHNPPLKWHIAGPGQDETVGLEQSGFSVCTEHRVSWSRTLAYWLHQPGVSLSLKREVKNQSHKAFPNIGNPLIFF